MQKSKDLKNTIFIIVFGLALIAVGLFTDYTITIFRITIPQWLMMVAGAILIVGWFVLGLFPDKYDKHGNPLKKD